MVKCKKCNIDFECTSKLQWCKECKKEYDRLYYKNNKDINKNHKRQLQKNRQIRNRQYMWDYLKSHPCIDCGEKDPVVLEFDHQGDKEYALASMIGEGLERIQEEINKCVIRCANCHRRKTAKQLNWHANIIK